MKKRIIRERPRRQGVYNAARAEGLSHVQADILCRRSLSENESLTPFYDPRLREISPPQLLKNCELAVNRIVEAIKKEEHIGLATDYDVDGLTANAVGQKSFGDYFGVERDLIHSFVGNRLQDGYGLTDQLCARILAHVPPVSLLITADCGVSDARRIALLKEAGVDVIVTDHHLVPEDEFPAAAYALVNPQQQGCPYPDKTISGSMVCWLVMSAVRTELLAAGLIAAETPTLISLLDYVALATIADSVSLLSPINRAVVRYGLLEINKFVRPCWQGMEFGSRSLTRLTEGELAFQVSPRINGAGRMGDPQLALDFLLAPDQETAKKAFLVLTETNQLRKEYEAQAMVIAHALAGQEDQGRGIVVYHPDFHPGILGIMASRLAESYGVPAIVLGKTATEGVLAGSCRTNGTVHIFKMLSQAAALEKIACQDNIISFGGHRGAAGLKLHQPGVAAFRAHFLAAIAGEEGGADVTLVETDGALAPTEITLATCAQISVLEPFGQHFAHPVFVNKFTVKNAKFVGKEKDHLQLTLTNNKGSYRGIWFRAQTTNPQATAIAVSGNQIYCLYQLSTNEYRGQKNLQLCITDVAEEKP